MILFSFLLTISLLLLLIGCGPRTSFAHNPSITSSLTSADQHHISIEVNELQLQELPAKFKSEFLPSQELCSSGRELDIVGIIDSIPASGPLNYEPFKALETGSNFLLYHGGVLEELPFQMSLSCLGEMAECDMYPVPLKRLLNGIDVRKRTIFLVGGFLNKAPKEWQMDIAARWQMLEDVNIIIFGWNGANQLPYGQAIQNTRIASRQISIFIYYLAKVHGLDLKNDEFLSRIHIIGHSLGAHISGFVGKDFGGKLGRITGLDPAGPSFSDALAKDRLDIRDARLVDAYHSNAMYEYNVYMGILRHVGHIDYYPNGGNTQPGQTLGQTLDIFRYSHEIIREHYVGSLDYLLKIQSKLGNNSMRLLSFPTHLTYNDFQKGFSFVEDCPKFAFDLNLSKQQEQLQLGANFPSNSKTHIQDLDLQLCSSPIDLTSGPDMLQQELAQRHTHQLDSFYQKNHYYFTRADKPFVMDSQLFKMKLVKRISSITRTTSTDSGPSTAASLRTTLLDDTNFNIMLRFEMFRGNRLTKNINGYKLHEKQGEYHLIAPFESITHSSKFELVELEANNYLIGQPVRQWASFEEIFPINIAITLAHEPLKKIIRSVSNKTRDWLFRATGKTQKSDTDTCNAIVDSVRIQPLSNLSRLVMAIYTNEKNSSEQSPQIVELNEGEPFPEVDIDQNEVDCLTESKSEMKVKLYLHSIVIGPKQQQ